MERVRRRVALAVRTGGGWPEMPGLGIGARARQKSSLIITAFFERAPAGKQLGAMSARLGCAVKPLETGWEAMTAYGCPPMGGARQEGRGGENVTENRRLSRCAHE